MIKTLSLCPTCYKKIEAFIDIKNGMAVMTKECDVHGPFSAIVERSAQHVSDFYRIETLGNNILLLFTPITHVICHVHGVIIRWGRKLCIRFHIMIRYWGCIRGRGLICYYPVGSLRFVPITFNLSVKLTRMVGKRRPLRT